MITLVKTRYSHEYHEDIITLRSNLSEAGYRATYRDCADVWEEYSESLHAGWLALPESDECVRILKDRLVVHGAAAEYLAMYGDEWHVVDCHVAGEELNPEFKVITALVRESETPLPPAYPDILMYTVKMPRTYTKTMIKSAVAEERAVDLSVDDDDTAMIDQIANGLEIIMTLDGNVSALDDYRG